MENITTQQKNKMAVNFGLMTGVIYIVLTSGINLCVSQGIFVYFLLKVLGYAAYVVIIGNLASRIRKANGGFIEFREIFGAVFIMVLIAATMSYVYNYLYQSVLDPHFLEKLQAKYMAFIETMNIPQEKKDKIASDFQTNIEEAKHFTLGKNVLALFELIVIDCLFGLIICAVVRKKRPQFQ